jgi:pimeloyl-ACP methyl ester carboxylesterase
VAERSASGCISVISKFFGPMRIILASLSALMIMLVTGCGIDGETDMPSGTPGMVNVEGRPIYLTCMGTGSPTVVLEAGGTGNSDNWSSVQQDIAAFTRVCAYDRAGEGFSSSVPALQSIEAMVRDLRSILRAGDIDGPFVIVGHSFGGRLARAFASIYPDEVIGMVLVDPGDEDFLRRAKELLTAEEWSQYSKVGGGIFARMKAFQRNLKIGPTGVIPIVVLSATEGIYRSGLDDEINKKLHGLLVTLHKELVAQSSNGTHVVAENSGHGIQDDRPDLVIDAIRQVTAN